MKLKEIFNLINEKSFHKAKQELILLKKSENSYDDINFTIAQVNTQIGEFNEAKKNFQEHLKKKPKDYIALFYLGNLYMKTYDIDKVEKLYLKVLELKKNYIPAIINLAYFYNGVGNLNKAKQYYLRAIEIDPNNINYHYSLSRLDINYIDEKKIKFLKNFLDKGEKNKKDFYLINFILSKYYEKINNYSKEIDFLNKSHKNFLKYNLNNTAYNFWTKHLPLKIDEIVYKDKINKKFFHKLNPIFIIGLPRSGSTITELMLSSSESETFSLGESSFINSNIIKSFGEVIFKFKKKNVFDLDIFETKLKSFFYNLDIREIEKKIIIDKSLENFFFIDIILKIFPKAKFVINKRNIFDNLIGIYKKMLIDLPWAHSLDDIINYVDDYLNIIKTKKFEHKKKFFFIELESLLSKDKKKLHELFNFCKLEYPKKEFNFQEKYTLVKNASNIQIREKINFYDKKKYSPYYKILDQYKKKYNWIKI